MKYVKQVISMFHKILMIELVFCFALIVYFPDKVTQLTGYRLYTVMTDSMEPTIPTFSLVLTRIIPIEEEIKPNTIVTFKANRFGDNILLTHYFRETQVGNDGNTYYRTQAEGKDFFDNYETKRSDIIGTYVCHIPFVGKFFLFLKSEFGFIWYGELAIVFLINKVIKTRWDEKEEKELVKDMA
ncbi:S26 family signal peptidase [Candidatus Stoquefichus massiliensis]|uniref:S26 family signal peptidase n=1 Tax=Candidatus Stoquefichus massiliensis TaxID=1470350 RepID=UPI00048466CD|nr:S26 family signal peptidase [Candidatus Stoquefichus massiliensis]